MILENELHSFPNPTEVVISFIESSGGCGNKQRKASEPLVSVFILPPDGGKENCTHKTKLSLQFCAVLYGLVYSLSFCGIILVMEFAVNLLKLDCL